MAGLYHSDIGALGIIYSDIWPSSISIQPTRPMHGLYTWQNRTLVDLDATLDSNGRASGSIDAAPSCSRRAQVCGLGPTRAQIKPKTST